MTVQHSSIPDAQLHEPKGVVSVPAGQVYVSNGLSSGTWKTLSRYGELYITGGVTGLTLSAASAFSRLDPGTQWVASSSSGVTLTAADGTMTIIETGVYQLDFWAVFTTAVLAINTNYRFRFAVNAVTSTRQASTSKITAGADSLDVSAGGLVSLVAGDVLSIYAAGDAAASGTNITVTEAGFSLHKV